MSRSSYSDDYGDDFPGQINLFRANVDRSIKSRNGQARLLELRAALVAMPVKELEAEIFAEGSQESPRVCGLGAWALARCGGDVEKAHGMVPRDADDTETSDVLRSFGWPKLLVYEAIYQNDEGSWRVETPVDRYRRMLAWVNANLLDPSGADHTER
jgi:hypothetical protein